MQDVRITRAFLLKCSSNVNDMQILWYDECYFLIWWYDECSFLIWWNDDATFADICREAQEFEPACPTSILILVVHGGWFITLLKASYRYEYWHYHQQTVRENSPKTLLSGNVWIREGGSTHTQIAVSVTLWRWPEWKLKKYPCLPVDVQQPIIMKIWLISWKWEIWHSGSVLDGDTDLAVRKSDVTTFRSSLS